jgi:hypothetical protein
MWRLQASVLFSTPDVACSSHFVFFERHLPMPLERLLVMSMQVFEILEAAGTAILFVIIYHVWAGA